MKTVTKYYFALLLAVSIYYAASKVVFDKVNNTIQIVIDELFHIPQGVAFCKQNVTHWDPKITTLPGLYLVSSAALSSYFPCTTYNLRFVNLVASCTNLLLFASILRVVYGTSTYIKTVMQAVNLALLPPLYFFSHVYYTDTLSLTFLLMLWRLSIKNKHKFLILILSFCCVLMRQTNIVWIAMVFGRKLLNIFICSSRVMGNNEVSGMTLSKHSSSAKTLVALKQYYNLQDFFIAVKYHLRTYMGTFFYYLFQDVSIIITHCITLLSFVAFVYVNGSIVVGDKSAHVATFHITQLLYFLLFYGVFGLPYIVMKLPSTVKLIFSNKIKVFFFAVLFAFVVHYNTIVHPYLLADNRHYTFYVWNRWFGKYEYAIYATIPAYIFLLFSLYDNLHNQNCITFLLPYTVCVFLALGLQKMIEVRYFLVPYIVLRLRFVRATTTLVALEFLWYIAINVVTFYLFFNKEIQWKDFDYPQRLIW